MNIVYEGKDNGICPHQQRPNQRNNHDYTNFFHSFFLLTLLHVFLQKNTEEAIGAPSTKLNSKAPINMKCGSIDVFGFIGS